MSKLRRGKKAETLQRPTTREALRDWVAANAGLNLPGKAVCRRHQTPLDYLEYAFLERGDTADTVVWACRGGGKTTIGAVATLLDLLFKPGIQVKILGGSREQSQRMYEHLCALVESRFAGEVRGKISSRGFTLCNGSKVEILTQSQRAVRGTRVQRMRCDEVELFDPKVWAAAQLTTRSLATPENTTEGLRGRSAAPATAAAESSAPGPTVLARGAVEVFSTLHLSNGIMAQLVGPPDDDEASGAAAATDEPAAPALFGGRRIFRWCIWDVIACCPPETRACAGCELEPWCKGKARRADGFVSVEDVLQLKRRCSRRLWDSEMLCLRPVPENPVFDAFSPALHVRPFAGSADQITVDGRGLSMEGLIAGIDYGWRRFACLWVVMLRDGAGRRAAWVVDEYVQDKRDLPGHAAAILARPVAAGTAEAYYADIAGRQHDHHSGRTSEALLKEAGLAVKSRSMGIMEGVEAIRRLIEPPETWDRPPQPRLWVDPRCKHTIAGLTGYAMKNDEPVKDGIHDHVIDALRYALVGHDGGGGKVETRRF